MLRMALEREAISHIRHRIDTSNDEDLFTAADAEDEASAPSAPLRIRVGSRQKLRHVSTYAHDIESQLGFDHLEFIDKLAEFLRDYCGITTTGNDFSGDGFEGDQFDLRLCRVNSLPLNYT